MNVLITCAVITVNVICEDLSAEFPDILDLFPNSAINGSNGRRSHFDKKDMIVDLDTLDEKRFLKNVDTLKKEIQSLGFNSTFVETSNTSIAPQRRTFRPLTIYGGKLDARWTTTIYYNWKVTRGIVTYMWSMKISDLMTQFIYMARHKLMELDSSTIVKPKPENYRQIFLYKHLVRLSDKLWDVHQIIRNQSKVVHYKHIHYLRVWLMLTNAIRLHQKAVKLYADFSYFWAVFMRIQEKFMERTHVVITRPPSTQFTFRTTASLPINKLFDLEYPKEFDQYPTPAPGFFQTWYWWPTAAPYDDLSD